MQVSAWQALFNFHESHKTADSVPFSPRTIAAGTGNDAAKLTLTGLPVAWNELWSKLHRFPRPHLSSASEAVNSDAGAGADSLRRTVTNNTAPGNTPLPLPLLNSVTGINHAPGARKAAKARVAAAENVGEMPQAAEVDEDILAGGLYFIEIPLFEGEMRIGVGRPERDGNENGTVVVSWLQRRGWSNDPAAPGFMWSGTLSFDAAVGEKGRGVLHSCEPLDAFLPVPVELTELSAHRDKRPLNHKSQKLRIPKKCVDKLRAYCALKCPDLLRTPAEAAASSQIAGAGAGRTHLSALAGSSSGRSLKRNVAASRSASTAGVRKRRYSLVADSDEGDDDVSQSECSDESEEREATPAGAPGTSSADANLMSPPRLSPKGTPVERSSKRLRISVVRFS
eukprot:6209261-Pleurochrysis_carterae.AAC.2